MINQGLQFIATELTDFLNRNMPDSHRGPVVVNSIRDQLKNNRDPNPDIQKASVVICVVNVEEDNLSRSGSIGISHLNRQPAQAALHMNVYCLVAITEENYSLSLTFLSTVIAFFRRNAVFDMHSSPVHRVGLKKIVTDAVNLNTEQIYQVWQTMGMSYMPSVLYRFRLTGEFSPQETSPAFNITV